MTACSDICNRSTSVLGGSSVGKCLSTVVLREVYGLRSAILEANHDMFPIANMISERLIEYTAV